MRTIALAIILLTLFWLLYCLTSATGAGAQAATATPLPGPIATATAAAQRMSTAQSQQSRAAQIQQQADAQRAQAAQLQEQANAAQAAADEAYRAAAQAAADARSAMAAQQAQAAGEAIGRSEARINDGLEQVGRLSGIVSQQKAIIDAQSSTVMSLTLELQQARTDKQNVLTAYSTLLQQQEEHKNDVILGNSITLFAFIVVAVLVIAFAVYVLQHRRGQVTIASTPASTPESVIDSDYETVEGDET